MPPKKKVIIYTDGACSGNPGPGGWGSVLLYGKHRKEMSGGFDRTTNNRMELLAVVMALQGLKVPCRVEVYSDSKYVVDSVSKKWVYQWEAHNFFRGKKKQKLNIDLWEQLLVHLDKHEVQFFWVEGHSGVEENERCDQLAREAILQGELPIDLGYLPGAL